MNKKKINPKDTAKAEVIEKIKTMFAEGGITTRDGVDFGFTATTLVVSLLDTDIQIKIMAPKAGVVRYEELND